MASKQDRRHNIALPGNGRERLHLLGWQRIAVLAAVIAAVMVVLYPRDRLIEEVSKSEAQDTLSRNYLDNLLKTEPENPKLLIKRAEAQIDAGREREAEQLLLDLDRQPDSTLRIDAAQTMLKLREKQLFAQPPDSRQRQQRLAAVHRALVALGDLPLDLTQRAQLARKAVTHSVGDLAMRLYRALAEETGGDSAVGWIEESAKAAQSLGRYHDAATLYFEARQRSTAESRRTANFQAGVRALQAGNLPLEALKAAENELGDLADDPEILLFVVRVARSANRNDRAEIYIRKLLRYAATGAPLPTRQLVAVEPLPPLALSDSLNLSRRIPECGDARAQQFCWHRLPGAHPVTPIAHFHKIGHGPQLPFNEEIYLQGYEIFLANRKLGDAQLVAEAAVKQASSNVDWRKRLAQVAEWNGKPDLALTHWRHIALTSDSDEAWQALLRLAPGLFDEDTVVLALTREYRRGRLDDARLIRLVEAFDALGESQRGIDFLRDGYRDKPRRMVLAQQAWLEERSGQADQAVQSLRRLEQVYGLEIDEVRHLAGLLIARTKLAEAYELLRQHSGVAERKDREYREYQALMAELGWRLQDRAGVKEIYQSLQAEGALEGYQTERLILLLRDDNPGAAADLAARYWDQHHAPRFLQLAIELHLRNRNLTAANALLARLSGTERAMLEKETSFLRLRADVRRQSGDLPGAIADMRQAVKRTPADVGLSAQLLWLLVEARDRRQLAVELRRRHHRALDAPDLWAPMGAGYVLLAKPAQALPYYAKQAVARRDDYLWLANYAQVLEDAGQAEMAWRLRRHAWLNLRKTVEPDRDRQEHWRAMTQLALRLAPGDVGAAWLRELLRQDVDGQGQLSPQAKELATAWFLSNEQYESARLWLTQQYGKQLAAPRWAEVALALQSNDKAELRKIVEGDQEDIDAVSRVEAAIQLGDHTAARRIATAGLEVDPDRDVLHLKLTESLWHLQDRVALAYRNEELGALRSEGWRADVQWHVSPQLKMSLEISRDKLSTRNINQLANLPDNDSRLALSGRLEHGLGETGAKLFYRDAVKALSGIELDHRLRIDSHLRVGAVLGYNLEADENAALKAAGAKDVFKLNAEWLIGRREYLIADMSANRYYDQDRGYLGRGTGLAMQLGHHLRMEYPNAAVKFMAGTYRFNESGEGGAALRRLLPPGAAALPGSFDQIGVGIDIGTVASDQYSRALRPYASLDLLHGSGTGWGYGLGLGFVFSPTGHDWLRGRYRGGRSRFSSSEDARLLDLEYRYVF